MTNSALSNRFIFKLAFILLLGLVLLLGIPLGLVWGSRSLAYKRYQQALAHWERFQPDHFAYLVILTESTKKRLVEVEMLEDEVLGIYELDHGFPMYFSSVSTSPDKLGIESLFATIEGSTRLHFEPGEWLLGLYMKLTEMINRRRLSTAWTVCQKSAMQVKYNPDRGYPEFIKYPTTYCFTFHINLIFGVRVRTVPSRIVQIEEFKLLPLDIRRIGKAGKKETRLK